MSPMRKIKLAKVVSVRRVVMDAICSLLSLLIVRNIGTTIY